MQPKKRVHLEYGRRHVAKFAACGFCAAVLFGAGAASAQSMDYGSLESLFGEPVTTSVTGSPQRASDVPASMIIVTQDEIRRSGARNIPQILRHVPGLDVLQWTNDQADVAVRGYNQPDSPRLLVLVDGRQVYSDSYGYTPWSAIPVQLSDIRQIEIVMGPNSALFGFNAVGGVVNIITYDPLHDDIDTLSLIGGTQDLIGGSATVTYPIGKDGGVRLSLGGRRDTDFATPQQPTDVGTRNGDYRKAIDLLGHFRLAQGVDASLELSHAEAAEPEFSATYLTLFAQYRTSSLKGRVAADTGLGLIEATAYMNWYDTWLAGSPTSGVLFHVTNPVYVVQLQDIFKPGPAHTIRVSFEYRHNAMETTPIGGAHVFYSVLAGGAMWDWAIMPELKLTDAVRIDHLSLGRSGPIPPGLGLTNADWNGHSITAFSFNSGLVWHPDDADTFRFTAARGVQLPSLVNFGGVTVPTPLGYYAGLPTMKPTIVMNYGLDWVREVADWGARIRLRLFHQTTKDIVADIGGSAPLLGLILTPADAGNSEATGLELNVDGTFADDWRWGLSYTPEVISDHFLPGFSAKSAQVDFADTHPDHVVNANLGWAQGPWEIDGYLRYESAFHGLRTAPGPNPIVPSGEIVRIADYVSVDARIAYRLTDNLTASLSGQNLLQSPQVQTSAPAIERSVQFAVTANF